MLSVILETVTPLFLGGAVPRGAPELRTATIRGSLRFWLRALLAGAIGDRNLRALREAEAMVFGSTESGASPVVVRVLNAHHDGIVPFSKLVQPDSRTGSYGWPGIAYLFFSARRTLDEPERSAIPARSTFELDLHLRTGLTDRDALRKACAALWLLTHLGGLGARSRRGAGSVQVKRLEKSIPDSELPPLRIRAGTPDDLQKELQQGLRRLREMSGITVPTTVGQPSTFDVLHPDVCKIWVVKQAFASWEEALDSIGRQMQRFRREHPPDCQNVEVALRGCRPAQPVEQVTQRAVFGLPIVFYHRPPGGAKWHLTGERHDRRASPVLIRVTRLTSGKYALVLTFFRAHLLEPGENLKLERQGHPATVVPPDLSLIDIFMEEIRNGIGPCLEVTGW